MSVPFLNVANAIVMDNGTMYPHFRDFLLRISNILLPLVKDITDTTLTLAAGNANQVNRFTGANPAITIPPDTYAVRDIIIIRQAGTGTLVLTTTGYTINGTIPSWAQHVETAFRVVATNTLDVI